MEEITKNQLEHDGMMRVCVLSDQALQPGKYIGAIHAAARSLVEYELKEDTPLSLYTLNLCWPVVGPMDVQYLSEKKFRRFYFLHFIYAERVSECVRMAADIFETGTGYKARDAYVRTFPAGAVDFIMVHGCQFIEAEWMPANCVAVGGKR